MEAAALTCPDKLLRTSFASNKGLFALNFSISLISFVIEVCKALNLEMIGEGIENEEQKKAMMDIGCKIGQGFLMHKPEFLETFKTKINSDD